MSDTANREIIEDGERPGSWSEFSADQPASETGYGEPETVDPAAGATTGEPAQDAADSTVNFQVTLKLTLRSGPEVDSGQLKEALGEELTTLSAMFLHGTDENGDSFDDESQYDISANTEDINEI